MEHPEGAAQDAPSRNLTSLGELVREKTRSHGRHCPIWVNRPECVGPIARSRLRSR